MIFWLQNTNVLGILGRRISRFKTILRLTWYCSTQFLSIYTRIEWMCWAQASTHYWNCSRNDALYLSSDEVLVLCFWLCKLCYQQASHSTFSLPVSFWIFFSTKPDYSNMKVFRCLFYPWLRPYAINKLEPRSSPCTFLGYSKLYRCLNFHSQKFDISRHVLFDELVFPFAGPMSSITSSTAPISTPNSTFSLFPVPYGMLPQNVQMTATPVQQTTLLPHP